MNNDQATTLAVLSALFAGLPALLNLFFTLLERRRNNIAAIAEKQARLEMTLAVEKAELAAKLAAQNAKELKATVIGSKVSGEKQIRDLGESIKGAIKDNTDMNEEALKAADKAYKEANGLSGKILALGLERRAEAAAESKVPANVTIETQSVEVHSETPPTKSP